MRLRREENNNNNKEKKVKRLREKKETHSCRSVCSGYTATAAAAAAAAAARAGDACACICAVPEEAHASQRPFDVEGAVIVACTGASLPLCCEAQGGEERRTPEKKDQLLALSFKRCSRS